MQLNLKPCSKHIKKHLPINLVGLVRGLVMLKIKLYYVILSILLVFNLFEKSSCARSGGGGKTIRGRNNCKGGGGGWTPITGSIDCKYFLKTNT